MTAVGRRSPGTRGACRAATLSILVAWAIPCESGVKINEIAIQEPEFVEFYNSGPDTVKAVEYALACGAPLQFAVLSITLPPGGFVVRYLGSYFSRDVLNDEGSLVELRLWTPGFDLVDGVSFGYRGAAPVGGFGSIIRYPDGDDTGDDARDFEFVSDSVGVRGTPGQPNVAAAPDLGSDMILNEIKWYPDGVTNSQAIEIYNPSGTAVDLHRYWIIAGERTCQVSGHPIVQAKGVRVLSLGVSGEGFDCEASGPISIGAEDVVYLYRPPRAGESYPVRVDQLGFNPMFSPPDFSYTFQRCTDGAGPNDGYDYPTSGGGESYFVGPATLGGTNNGLCVVQARSSTWGRVKGLYR